MLRVTPLYGSRWSPQAEEPSCTLVEFSGCRILWNVGWWPGATAANSNSSQDAADGFPDLPEHDCVILSDSTLQACGGLPLYYQQQVRKFKAHRQKEDAPAAAATLPPIYATLPTVKMGQMTLYDQHAATSLDGHCPAYSLDDIDSVFAAIHSIKYSQSLPIYNTSDNNNKPALSITAHRAGHVVGAAVWLLQRTKDDTTVVLQTSRYNMAKELVLDSCTLLQHGMAPDVLVTSPGGPSFAPTKALAHAKSHRPVLVSQAQRQWTESVLAVLRRDGNVLVPTDAAGRALELLVLLNQLWDRQRLGETYELCFLGPMVRNTVEFARAQLEWMHAKLMNTNHNSAGGNSRQSDQHPLQLPHVQWLEHVSDLQAFANPVCCLAVGLDLEQGPSRNVLLQWADNPDNAILLTDSSQAHYRRRRQVVEKTTSASTTVLAAATLSAAGVPMTVGAESAVAGVVVDDKDDLMGAAGTTAGADDGEEGAMVIVPPEQASPWTVAGQFMEAWTKAKVAGQELEDVLSIDVYTPVQTPLAGPELAAFMQAEEQARAQKRRVLEQQAMLREVELAKGRLRLGGDDEKEKTTTVTATSSQSAASSGRPKRKSRFDSSLFLKFSKPLHLTFEVREDAVGIGQPDSIAKYGIGESVGRSGEILEDDYGISVQPEFFTDIVSGVDPSKFAGGSGRIGEDVLRRGFGLGADMDKKKKKKTSKSGSAGIMGGPARVSEDEDDDEMDSMDEAALAALDLSEGTGIIRGRNGQPPTKVSTVLRRLDVLAEVSYVPLEGRVDARAARQSVRALQPRQVIVLGGRRPEDDMVEEGDYLVDEVALLAKAAETFATSNEPVHTPSNGEVAELLVGHAAYGVRLVDTPYQSKEEKEAAAAVEAVPLEPVERYEAKLGVSTVSLLDVVATGQKVALDGSIVLAPRPESAAAIKEKRRAEPSIHLSDGEVLLTDLRAELSAQGMKAEYSAHSGFSQLIVNGKIILKKDNNSGRVHVEGPLCEDFWTIRAVVRKQYVCL